MSAKSQSKHLKTLTRIYKRGTATVKQARITAVEALRLEKQGLIARVSTVRTGKRGRPAIQWRLTDKARKRVKRAHVTA